MVTVQYRYGRGYLFTQNSRLATTCMDRQARERCTQ
jgi:hypothetical protein